MKVVPTSVRTAIIGVLGTLVTAASIGAWNSKESVDAHGRSIDSVKAEARAVWIADSAWHAQMHDDQLEMLCTIKPKSHKCSKS